MATAEAVWGPVALRFLRSAVVRTTKAVRQKLATASRPLESEAQQLAHAKPQTVSSSSLSKQPQQSTCLVSGTVLQNAGQVTKRFISTESKTASSKGLQPSTLPQSNTSQKVSQFSGRAPFASALRPNLTGGAIPRTAGGYSLGGGARYFSHTPAAPAQVVQNVSQAMRGFFVSGQKLRYDGVGPRGNKQYRAVSQAEDAAMNKLANIPRSTPGASLDFSLSPRVTAMSPLAAAITNDCEKSGFKAEIAATQATLNTEGFLDLLSVDFDRALKDLAAIYADLRRLAVLGDLPISMEKNNILRVRFPGVDASTVRRLCDDIGIERGVVSCHSDYESSKAVGLALKFPFAPESPRTIISSGGSDGSANVDRTEDLSSLGDESFVHEVFLKDTSGDGWVSESEDFEALSSPYTPSEQRASDYEGFEGIYRFLEECDGAKGRLG